MSEVNLFQKLDKLEENIADNIVHGKDEDIFVRNARRKEFEKKYGNRHLAAWLPGFWAYVNIKNTIKNPEYTKKQKIIMCGFDIFSELVLDAVRIGGVYGLYKFIEYSNK